MATRLTAQKLANLYPRAKLLERKVTSILQKAGVPNVRGEGGGYDVFPATEAIIEYYKSGYEARDIAGESDRARKNKAEADAAELSAIRARGETCLMSAAKMFASETRIMLRQTIERADFLTKDQRKKLLEKIAGVRVALPDAEPG